MIVLVILEALDDFEGRLVDEIVVLFSKTAVTQYAQNFNDGHHVLALLFIEQSIEDLSNDHYSLFHFYGHFWWAEVRHVIDDLQKANIQSFEPDFENVLEQRILHQGLSFFRVTTQI